ncbi:hypothetical protein TNCV_970721 [Trichonephila clavipes]|nr:hypothetical protein TNCV_970721 [Trichonephila clavipes]
MHKTIVKQPLSKVSSNSNPITCCRQKRDLYVKTKSLYSVVHVRYSMQHSKRETKVTSANGALWMYHRTANIDSCAKYSHCCDMILDVAERSITSQ